MHLSKSIKKEAIILATNEQKGIFEYIKMLFVFFNDSTNT